MKWSAKIQEVYTNFNSLSLNLNLLYPDESSFRLQLLNKINQKVVPPAKRKLSDFIDLEYHPEIKEKEAENLLLGRKRAYSHNLTPQEIEVAQK